MPARSLYTMLGQAAKSPGSLRPNAITTSEVPSPSAEAQTFVDRGTVAAITDVSVMVQFQGQQEVVRRATDEPLFPGQSVFVSRDRGGHLVVHGSVG